MKAFDYLIIAIVALAVAFAVYKTVKKKPRGCGGDCAHCSSRTPGCEEDKR
jgi:cobalamin synthase